MKKLVFGLFCFSLSVPLYAFPTGDVTVTGKIIGERMDVSTYGKVASIGFLDGSSQTTAGIPSTYILDEGTLQGGATWFNFVGANITASVTGGTATITISGAGGGGGAGALFIEPAGVSVSTLFFPTSDFSFRNGTNISTVSVKNSTGDVTASWTFKSTQTFVFPVSSITINGNLIVTGSATVMNVLTSTTGFIAPSATFTFVSASTFIAGSSATIVNLGVLRVLRMNNFGIASSTGLEVGIGLQVTNYFSTADTRMNGIGVVFATDTSRSGSIQNPATGYFNMNNFGITNSSGLGSGQLVIEGSGVFKNVVTSSVGFIAPSSTFSFVSVGTITVVSSMTAYMISTSSFSLTSGTTTINGVTYRWTPANPTSGQVLTADGSNNINWQTPTGGGGGGGAGAAYYDGSSSLAISTFVVRTGTANYVSYATNFATVTLAVISVATATMQKTYDYDAVSLQALTTDFAAVDSTFTNTYFPYLGRLFDKATTSYMSGKLLLPSNLDVSSTVIFTAIIRSTNPVASKNVQLLFKSTATDVPGPSFLDFTTSTGADTVALTNSVGFMDKAIWSQSVSALNWKADQELFFKFGRGHDTSILTSTDYPGGLYILNVRISVPIIVPGGVIYFR